MIQTRVLEANIVHHCNNRCASCNHGSPFSEPYTMSPKTLERDLSGLSKILHTEFFCLQGGEPLLHPDIVGMMQVAWRSGIADRYGILTNGRLLDRQSEDFWGNANLMGLELRMTIYANLPASIEPWVREKTNHYTFIKFCPGKIEKFTKVLGHYPQGESFSACRWKTCHTVHEGHFYICPLSTFWPSQFMDLTPTIDGYPIETATETGLLEFIKRSTPLNSCRRCTGEQAPSILWHEVMNREEWMRESTA